MPYPTKTRKQQSRSYYERNRERLLAKQRAYHEAHKEERKQYVAANREKVNKLNRDWRERNYEQWRRITTKANAEYGVRLKAEFIAAYGGHCVCCGEDYPEFLTVDHIGGGGTAERRELKRLGNQSDFYLLLKKRGWPKDHYRLLCMNCNFATRHGKPCPHESQESTLSIVAGLVC